MRGQDQADDKPTEVGAMLRRQINLRTWCGIQQLEIEATPERVHITGIASSYYLKQLALEAVKEVVPLASLPPVTLDILVHFREAHPVVAREYA